MQDKQKIEQQVNEVIVSVLDNPSLEINSNSSLIDDLGMDSVDFASLVMSLEDEFGGVIDEDQITNIVTVSDVVDLIHAEQN